MPISHENKVILIHIPKNAGTSIAKDLGIPDSEIGHWKWGDVKKSHPCEWDIYVKVAVVRNPWDRVVSNYFYSKMENSYWHSPGRSRSRFDIHPDYESLKGKSFEDCISLLMETDMSIVPHKNRVLKHMGWEHQKPYICNGDLIVVDHVLRQNTLNSEYEKIFGRKLEESNKSNRDINYRQYYTDDTRRMVGDYYKEDIDFFRWEF